MFEEFHGDLTFEKLLTPNPPARQAEVWQCGKYAVKIVCCRASIPLILRTNNAKFPPPSRDDVKATLKQICRRRKRMHLETPNPTIQQIKTRLDIFSNEAKAYQRIEEQEFTKDTRLHFPAYYGTTKVDGMNAVVLERLPRSGCMTQLIPTAMGQPQFEMILDKLNKDIHEVAQIWLAEKYVSRLRQVRILHQISILHRDFKSDNVQVDGIHDGPLFDFGNSFIQLGDDEEDPLLPGYDPRKADEESVEFSILYL